jgi:hypothetical protein
MQVRRCASQFKENNNGYIDKNENPFGEAAQLAGH